MKVSIINITDQNEQKDNKYTVYHAEKFWDRFMGLMGKKSVPGKTGLLFKNCSSIHCFFMKIPIDVIYLDKDFTVLYKETVDPWHIGKFIKNTKHILELGKNEGNNIKIGDKILWLTIT